MCQPGTARTSLSAQHPAAQLAPRGRYSCMHALIDVRARHTCSSHHRAWQPPPPSTLSRERRRLHPEPRGPPVFFEDLEQEGGVGKMWKETRETRRRAGPRCQRGRKKSPAGSVPRISGLEPGRCRELSFCVKKVQGGSVSWKPRLEPGWDGPVPPVGPAQVSANPGTTNHHCLERRDKAGDGSCRFGEKKALWACVDQVRYCDLDYVFKICLC